MAKKKPKYETYEYPRKRGKKDVRKFKPKGDYPPKYKVYGKPRRSSACRKGVK